MNDAMARADDAAAVLTSARGGLIHDTRYTADAAADVFVSSGQERAGRGRGAIRIVVFAGTRAVIRHYRRGGLVARVNDDWFPWFGADHTRPFREFRITQRLRQLGLAVPEVIAARYQRSALGYRADLATREVPGACTLAERLAGAGGTASIDWAELGLLIAGFHRCGLWHADLNAHNVLYDQHGRPLLIDFDRARLVAPGATQLAGNLDRLARSLRKLGHGDVVSGEAWTRMHRAYDAHLRSAAAAR